MGESLCRLSTQESRALDQARKGASNKEISLAMNVSQASVSRLMQSATKKLNATLADIVQFCHADTVRCRELLPGEGVSVLVQEQTQNWATALSEAEKDVVAAAVRGQSNRDIARRRGRSVRTVANQLASAFEKIGVRSRRELVSRCGGHAYSGAGDA
jgi:DNA-binding NarL/FixJ family response regulator